MIMRTIFILSAFVVLSTLSYMLGERNQAQRDNAVVQKANAALALAESMYPLPESTPGPLAHAEF